MTRQPMPVVLTRLLHFFKPHWKLGALGGLLLLLNVILQLPMPLLTMYLVDHVVISGDFFVLHLICGFLILFIVVKSVSAYFQTRIFINFRNRVIFDVRSMVFQHVSRLPISFFDGNKAGYLSSRVSSELNNLHNLMANTLLRGLMDIITLIFGICIIIWLNWKLALISIALLPFHVYIILKTGPRIRHLNRERQEKFSNVMGDILETFSCMYVVKSFVAESRELQKMLTSFKDALACDFRAAMASNILSVGSAVISSLGRLSLIWIGLYLIMIGEFTLAGFLAFNSFLKYLFDPVNNIVNLVNSIQQGVATADRLFELMDLKKEEDDPDRIHDLKVEKGQIKVRDLVFSYADKVVINGMDLDIDAGSTLALVGKSGSGKSTLINLLMGLYQPRGGQILIDGQDLSTASLASLRSQIAVIPQETFLFTGDVFFNLRYGLHTATENQMIQAAKEANAHEFIMALPRGYQTPIGERGVRLSGGQKQRISIAMAVLKNAPILIFDEATASLDTETEREIQESLRNLCDRKTTIIIAHRLSSIYLADKIAVMDKGQIVAVGSHDDLLIQNKLYSNLFGNILKNQEASV